MHESSLFETTKIDTKPTLVDSRFSGFKLATSTHVLAICMCQLLARMCYLNLLKKPMHFPECFTINI